MKKSSRADKTSLPIMWFFPLSQIKRFYKHRPTEENKVLKTLSYSKGFELLGGTIMNN